MKVPPLQLHQEMLLRWRFQYYLLVYHFYFHNQSVIVDRDTLETQREERERYEEWLDNWDRSTEETQRWREEQQKKKQEQEMIMQQEEDEERKRLQDLEDYAYAAYSDESERQEYLRENGYYGVNDFFRPNISSNGKLVAPYKLWQASVHTFFICSIKNFFYKTYTQSQNDKNI